MRRFCKCGIMIAVACMILFCSVYSASAATFGLSYRFSLSSGGDRATSSEYKKTVTASQAQVNVGDFNNNSGKAVVARIREGSDKVAVTPTFNISAEKMYYQSYYSGYGGTGKSYYLRMQTQSSSTGSDKTTISGTWAP